MHDYPWPCDSVIPCTWMALLHLAKSTESLYISCNSLLVAFGWGYVCCFWACSVGRYMMRYLLLSWWCRRDGVVMIVVGNSPFRYWSSYLPITILLSLVVYHSSTLALSTPCNFALLHSFVRPFIRSFILSAFVPLFLRSLLKRAEAKAR